VCGSPPTTRCTPELSNPAADDAAKHGKRIDDLRAPVPGNGRNGRPDLQDQAQRAHLLGSLRAFEGGVDDARNCPHRRTSMQIAAAVLHKRSFAGSILSLLQPGS